MTLDKPDYLTGETIIATLSAKYFFGGNVPNAIVRWNLTASDWDFDRYTGDGGYSFGDFDYFLRSIGFGETIATGEGKTDASGFLTITVPADLSKRNGSATFSIEASVTDANDQAVATRANAIVHKGAYYIGVAPVNYVGQVGEEQAVNLLTVDWSGKPIATKPARRASTAASGSPRNAKMATASANTPRCRATRWFRRRHLRPLPRARHCHLCQRGRRVPHRRGGAQAALSAAVCMFPATASMWPGVSKTATASSLRSTKPLIKLATPQKSWRHRRSRALSSAGDDRAGRILAAPQHGAGEQQHRAGNPGRRNVGAKRVCQRAARERRRRNDKAPAFRIGYAQFDVDPKAVWLNVQIAPDKPPTVRATLRPTPSRDRTQPANPVQAELSVALAGQGRAQPDRTQQRQTTGSFYGLRALSVRNADSLSINVDQLNLAGKSRGREGRRRWRWRFSRRHLYARQFQRYRILVGRYQHRRQRRRHRADPAAGQPDDLDDGRARGHGRHARRRCTQ